METVVGDSPISFPGNKIQNPNPIGLLYLSKYPKCNLPSPTTCDSATTDVANNYGLAGMDPYRAHRFDVRVNWAKSAKQRIFTRFSYAKLIFSTANVFPSGWDLNYAQNTTNGRNVLVADDLTLNSTTVLNLRYSFARHYENQGDPAYSSIDITQLGFPSSLAAQQVFKQLPFMIFSDLIFPGNGIGGTGDYNTFVDASENSDAIPPMAVTIGMREVLSVRRIRLYSETGAWKQTVLRLVLFGEVSPEIPATYVQEHPDCLITVDSATSASPLVDA